MAQGGRLRRLGLLSFDSHHHLLLHALPARRAGLHLLIGGQSQRGVVLVLEAFVRQRGLEWRVVHGDGGRGPGVAERRGVQCSGVRARVLFSAAPYGHRALVRVKAPGCCSWRLRPGSFLRRHWQDPPSVRQDIPPLPCATHSAGRRSDASCRALPLPGGRWGVYGAGGSARCAKFPTWSFLYPSPTSRGDAPRSCSYRLLKKVCAQLRAEGDLCRGKGNFSCSAPRLAAP